MKLLRAILITCFVSFFPMIAYGQGEGIDIQQLETITDSCEAENTCYGVLRWVIEQLKEGEAPVSMAATANRTRSIDLFCDLSYIGKVIPQIECKKAIKAYMEMQE